MLGRVDGVTLGRVDGVRGSDALLSAAALLPSRVVLTVRHEAVLVLPQEIRRCTELCQSAAVALFDCFSAVQLRVQIASVLRPLA